MNSPTGAPASSPNPGDQITADAFMHCAHAIAVGDPVTRLVRTCNSAFARMLGREIAETIGLPISEVYAPPARDLARIFIAESDQTGAAAYESVMQRKDGTAFPVEISLVTVKSDTGAPLYRVASVKDLSALNRSEAARRASESRFTAIFHASPAGICLCGGPDGRIVDINPAFSILCGQTRSAVLGHTLDDLAFLDGSAGRDQLLAAVRSGRPVHEVEVAFTSKQGERGHLLISAEPAALEAGALVMLLASNITARKHSETALRIQRDLAVALSAATTIAEGAQLCLDAAIESVGFDSGGFYLRDEVTGELDLLHHRGLGEPFIAEVRHFTADSPQAQIVSARKPHYVEADGIAAIRTFAARSEGITCLAAISVHCEGRAVGCLNVASHTRPTLSPDQRRTLETIGADAAQAIARLRAEAGMREHAERLRLAVEAGQFGTFDVDLLSDRAIWSERAIELWGYGPGEFDGTTAAFRARVHPDDLAAINGIWQRSLATREPFAHEFRLLLPDGAIRWVASYGQFTFDARGVPIRLQGVNTDITKRKAIEDSLRAREELFASVVDQSGDAVAIVDARTGRIVEFNATAHQSLGYSRAEFAGLAVNDFQAHHTADEVRQNIERAISTDGAAFETQHRHRDGSLRDVRVSIRALRHQAHDYIVAVWTDITEQRKATAALRESEQSYREIFDAAADAIYLHDVETGRVLDVNDGMLRLFGFSSKEDYLASSPTATFVDDPRYGMAQAQRWLRRAIEQGPQVFEWRTRRKDGTEFWVEVSLRMAHIRGTPRVLAIVRDIDQRKNAERALSQTQQRLLLAADGAQIGTWDRDLKTGQLDWSTHQERLMGYEPGTFPGTDEAFSALIHPDSLAAYEEARQRARTGDGIYRAELCFLLRDGTQRWGLLRGHTEFDRHGKPERIIGIDIDITAQKRAEAALQHQSGLIKSLLDCVPDLIFYKDADGRYLGCNPAFAEFVGRPARDIVGRTDHDLFPRDVAEFFRWQDRLMLEKLESRRNEEWVNYPDGRRVLLDTLKTPYRGPDGKLVGVLGISRDITDRRRAENVQASRIRLLEFAATHSLDELLVATLDEAELLTGSQVGFYHFLQPDQVTLSLQAWSTRTTREMCRADGKGRHYDVQQAGVWVDCIRERRPVIHNDYASLAHRKGLPEGHAPVIRELVVPVFRGDLIVALLGVGNKPGPYEQTDVDQIFRLADLAWDIAERKRAEAARRESEVRFRNLVEASFDWIWEIDTQGRYTYASPRVKELLGYEPAEVIGRTPFDLMPPDEARRMRRKFGELALSQQAIVALENTNLHRDGRRVVIETNGVPSFAPDGTWVGYHGMDRDITARRAAERMLRLRGTALESAANAIVILDATGLIEWANPAFTTLSGWELSEALGRNPRELLDSGKHDDAFFLNIQQTIQSGQVWQGEIINRRKDGKLRTEEMSLTPLADEHGNVTHFIAIKQDVTERKLLEAQNRQAQRMEAIGTLAGGIAHDLNNILSPILIVAGLLKEQAKDERDQEMLGMLQQSAQRGADIIRQLLTFSRGVEGERIPVQPRHLVKEMASIIRETFPREIDLRLNLAANLGTVVADPTQLHQVLLNLCVNARDAMPDGGHLSLRAANVDLAAGAPELPPGAASGAYLFIEVRDSGHGIPPEIQHRIFDPFFTTKPIGKGTGLGLSTVQGIVHSHKGFVTVESTVGTGTAFKVFLPTEAAPASDVPVSPASMRGEGQGETILIVDDERNVREAWRMLLERRGYRVMLAVTGQDGLVIFQRHRAEIRLILTDIMMPVMNGLAMLRAVRAIDPKLPVITASGLGDVDNAAEQAELGVFEALTKPCAPDLVLRAVERALAASKHTS